MGLTMKTFRSIILTILIAGIAACNDSNNEAKQNTNTSTVQIKNIRQFIVANNFSNDAEWKNGILQKDGRSNTFYFLQESGAPLKIKIGDIISFTKTGNVTVQKVAPSAPNQNGIINVFVTVDKDLDPTGDGYPNKIHFGQ